jgi:glycosyltransferase involved in cell wall biosynthesis
MSPVRLLEIRNTYKWGGGPDKTVLLSAARHDSSRVSAVVAYIRGANDDQFTIADRAWDLGLTFYEIIERSKFDLRVIRAIREIIVRHDINLIHAHDYKTDLFAYLVRLVMRRRPLALLSTAHGWDLLDPHGEFYRRLDLRLMRRFDHLITVSQATHKGLVAAGLPASAISVIYNGIDADAWSPRQENEDLESMLGQEHHFPVVGYVGRIAPEKDLHTWLHAAALVKRRYPQARFILVGDGKGEILLHELQRLAVSLGLADHVCFYGYQENPRPFYAMCDIFMLSSVTEGLSNSILEAMAMGLPTVVTKVGGNEELVIDGQTGHLVRQGDAAGLAQAVIALAQHDQARRAMGRAGRRRVEREFSFAGRLQRIESLYERVVGVQPQRTYALDATTPP